MYSFQPFFLILVAFCYGGNDSLSFRVCENLDCDCEVEMGVRWVSVVVVGLVLLSFAKISSGGRTSSFVRNDDLSHDMPLDTDVFSVPPGYNAPQQVCI